MFKGKVSSCPIFFYNPRFTWYNSLKTSPIQQLKLSLYSINQSPTQHHLPPLPRPVLPANLAVPPKSSFSSSGGYAETEKSQNASSFLEVSHIELKKNRWNLLENLDLTYEALLRSMHSARALFGFTTAVHLKHLLFWKLSPELNMIK